MLPIDGRTRASIARRRRNAFDLLDLPAVYRPTFPAYVLSHDGRARGWASGATRRCARHWGARECGGTCYEVRWPHGGATWPCSADMEPVGPGSYPITWRIVKGLP